MAEVVWGHVGLCGGSMGLAGRLCGLEVCHWGADMHMQHTLCKGHEGVTDKLGGWVAGKTGK